MTEQSDSDRLDLQAGPVSMVFEPASGFLRYVRLGSDEILRGLYAAVRDRNWGTVSPDIRDLAVRRDVESFEVTFTAVCRQGDIDFTWRGRLTGAANGTVSYEFDGLADSTFLRNRVGFCVLHPIEPCAGKPCRVVTTDGAASEAAFPQWISAHQPLKDLRSIAHQVREGVWATVLMEGDTFEMEDQRNWTDASYKTYCTPLGLPFPVEVPKGTRIRQVVTISLEGALTKEDEKASAKAAARAASKAAAAPVKKAHRQVGINIDWPKTVPLPRIGLGVASHSQDLTDAQVDRLAKLNIDHLRVDLAMSGTDWAAALDQAAAQARRLDCSLIVALTLGADVPAQLSALMDRLQPHRAVVSSWLIFREGEKSTSPQVVEQAAAVLKAYDETAWVVAGTNAYFAELNRGPTPPEIADAVCYSINPQVHAFDDASLAETLGAQAYTVESARNFAGGKPVVVSPVTLRPRFNPNATGPEPPTPPGELPSTVDPRQPTLFAAGWTMGSLKYLAAAGAAAVTYYETTGWRGVMETQAGSPLPERFASLAGGVFPLYHVLADVGEFAGASAAAVRSADPLSVEAMALVRGQSRRLLLANLTGAPVAVTVGWSGATRLHRRVMDASNVREAMTSPGPFRNSGAEVRPVNGRVAMELPPHAVIRLDQA